MKFDQEKKLKILVFPQWVFQDVVEEKKKRKKKRKRKSHQHNKITRTLIFYADEPTIFLKKYTYNLLKPKTQRTMTTHQTQKNGKQFYKQKHKNTKHTNTERIFKEK